MPQLDYSAWPPQIFWLAVTFLALYFVITRYAIPRIGGTIHERRTVIEGDLGAAQKLKEETERAAEAYEKELADARGRAHAIARESRQKLTGEADSERAKVDGELSARIAEAEKRVAAMRDKALADAEDLAADIAVDIVSELTGAKVSKADAAGALARTTRN
jgi:F-type H+-transporting ATPase subunit b